MCAHRYPSRGTSWGIPYRRSRRTTRLTSYVPWPNQLFAPRARIWSEATNPASTRNAPTGRSASPTRVVVRASRSSSLPEQPSEQWPVAEPHRRRLGHRCKTRPAASKRLRIQWQPEGIIRAWCRQGSSSSSRTAPVATSDPSSAYALSPLPRRTPVRQSSARCSSSTYGAASPMSTVSPTIIDTVSRNQALTCRDPRRPTRCRIRLAAAKLQLNQGGGAVVVDEHGRFLQQTSCLPTRLPATSGPSPSPGDSPATGRPANQPNLLSSKTKPVRRQDKRARSQPTSSLIDPQAPSPSPT